MPAGPAEAGIARLLDERVLDAHPSLWDFAERIGRTPLMEVSSEAHGVRIFAKCEWHNPTGSVKDRPAFAMIYNLLKGLPPASVRTLHLVEHSGGNLAVSISRQCAALGIERTLVLSSSTPAPMVAALRAEGSRIEVVPKDEGFWGVMERARAIAAADPRCTYLDQHRNEANPWMHRNTTGAEIAAALSGLDGVSSATPVAWGTAIGTGGTLVGVYEALRAHFRDVRMFTVMPAELPYASPLPPNGLPKLAGSGGLGCGRKQPFVAPYDPFVKEHYTVAFDEALRAIKDFAARTDIRLGTSAAANILVAKRVAAGMPAGGIVITLLPSLATDKEWVLAEGLS